MARRVGVALLAGDEDRCMRSHAAQTASRIGASLRLRAAVRFDFSRGGDNGGEIVDLEGLCFPLLACDSEFWEQKAKVVFCVGVEKGQFNVPCRVSLSVREIKRQCAFVCVHVRALSLCVCVCVCVCV